MMFCKLLVGKTFHGLKRCEPLGEFVKVHKIAVEFRSIHTGEPRLAADMASCLGRLCEASTP